MKLTEQQRLAAIASCDRIEQLNKQMKTALKNIIRIFENGAAGRDPMDGIEKPSAICDCCDLKFQRSVMAYTTTSCGLETFACEGCRS